MADPLSTAASIASLIDLSVRTASCLHSAASTLKHAPEFVLDLANEVTELAGVLSIVEEARASAARLGPGQGTRFISVLDEHINNAKSLLSELEALSEALQKERRSTKTRVKWLFKKGNAVALKTKLTDVRVRIRDLLIAFQA